MDVVVGVAKVVDELELIAAVSDCLSDFLP